MATGAQCGVWNRQTGLNWHWTNKTSLNTWIFVISYCLQWLYKVPSLDDGGFMPWPLGPSVVFEIDKQRLNWRQTSITGLNMWIFCHKTLPITAVQSPQPRRWWFCTFGHILEKFRFFFRKFRKISILMKFLINFDFGENLRRISIFWKISKNFNLDKFSKNFNFGQIFDKIRFWSKFFENFHFFKNSKKFDFFENFENFCFSQIFENFGFWSKFTKILIFSIISKNFRFSQIFENIRF